MIYRMAFVSCTLLFLAAAAMTVPAQEKTAPEPVGVVKATIYLGPFE